jgi:hypothetical protein
MRKAMSKENKFASLSTNADLKKEEHVDTVIPEENKPINNSKSISFKQYQQNLSGLDFTKPIAEIFGTIIKHQQNVGLPESVDTD